MIGRVWNTVFRLFNDVPCDEAEDIMRSWAVVIISPAVSLSTLIFVSPMIPGVWAGVRGLVEVTAAFWLTVFIVGFWALVSAAAVGFLWPRNGELTFWLPPQDHQGTPEE